MSVATDLRAHKQAIALRWETLVLEEVPALAPLPRAALVDHMPEFLEGLATWLDGRREDAERAFALLAEGHALQRHSSGIALEALISEYVTLRRVILETLIAHTPVAELVATLVSLEAGLDRAIGESIKRYAGARDHVRERFIGILGHDLRDPLGAVMMSASLLSNLSLGDKQARLVTKISSSAERIERMIDDLLDFARGRLSGRIPIIPMLVDLGEICQAVVDESRSLAPDREVKLEAAGDLRGFFDRNRIGQALSNLVSNARHYGTGTVDVRVCERDDRQALLISVANAGIPIVPEVIGRIFDPFARGTTMRRSGGLGLGLYIVEQIALAHGGSCIARSSQEQGTTFTIELPRVPLEQTPGRPPV
ncbi:MAG: HAMP domain-containing sensor histidine kinase [Kofleriaceae bacterium]